MKRSTLSPFHFIAVLCSVTLITISYLYFSSNRFATSKSDDRVTYKIDKWTGKTWLLVDGRQVKIQEPRNRQTNTNSTDPIILAKTSYDLPATNELTRFGNEHAIVSLLSRLKGDLKIIGWSSHKINDQTYLVSYEYLQKEKIKGHYFDINLRESIVRYVNQDPYLLNEYSQYTKGYSSLEYLYDRLKKSTKGLPDYETFKKNTVNNLETRKVFYDILEKDNLISLDYEDFNRLYFSD